MTDIVGNATARTLWEGLVDACGDREFLLFCDREGTARSSSYREFDQKINRAANVFLGLGVQKGERVAVQLPTCPEFVVCLFGLAKIGAVMVPLNEQYLAEELAYALERTQAACAVVDEALLGLYRKIQDAGAGAALSRGLLLVKTGGGVARRASPPRREAAGSGLVGDFAELCERAAPTLVERRPLSADDPLEIVFTSGTTARPKGVVITHANFLYSGVYGAWQVGLRRSDRLLTTMPACHSNFQLAALSPVLSAGGVLVMVEKYSARRYWSQIRSFKATLTQCVSMMLRTLMLQPHDPDERRHELREVLYFLPVPEGEKRAFEERFGVSLMNTYGSTESVCWVLTDPVHGPRRWPSVGRAGLGYEVRIAREDGSSAAPGEVGEIQVLGVRGRSVMKGYYRDEEASRAAFTPDGWLRTGDRGSVDEDGWFYFAGRRADMIKRAGENIAASEVETVISGHPAVQEAAVIGVPDPVRDEAVKAFVLPKRGAALTKDEIVAYCARHMAAYKVPSIVEIVESFPHTCSMKIEKKLLR